MQPIIETRAISELFPNPWNVNVVSPDNQLKIEASIKRLGMFKPLVCRTLNDGRIEILGGQHRWEAAKSIGIETVEIVNLGNISDTQAKEISIVDNGRYGSDDGFKLTELLQEIGDITDFTPYTESDISQLVASSEIDLDAIGVDESEDELEKKVEELTKSTPSYQMMRFKVPLGDAETVQSVINKIIEKQGFTSSDSLTNAGDALVYLCGLKE